MKARGEIIDALEVIRDVCKEHQCDTCPLRYANGMSEGGCELENVAPEEWELNIVDDTWRAFKD